MSIQREKIQALEQVARQLEPASDPREELLGRVGSYVHEFLETLPDAQTYCPDSGESAVLSTDFPEHATPLKTLLHEFRVSVNGPGINAASGGHMGYIPGGGVYPSALGDYLADATNRFAGIAFASPGAVRMERALIRWMADLVGYPPGAGGDLTSGGSIANLSALVTARESHAIRSGVIPTAPIYMTAQVHHCIDKALRIAGLSECPRRVVPMDDRYRMDVGALSAMVQAVCDQGLRPWLIVASAGTTDLGAVDPVEELARVAEEYGLWLHLDAAYGGFFLLCEEGRSILGQMGLADSIVMDPHKGLFLPYGSGALLVKDVHQLACAHSYEAHYMQDAKHAVTDYSPADISPELSRPFRGVRLWLPLKLLGLEPFRAALAEKIWLARYFYERIAAVPGFELGPEPDLSVVTYRYVPEHGDANEFNQRLLARILEDGKVFVSSTSLDGVFTLRLAVLNFRTHLEHVDYLVELLVREAERLEKE